MRFEALLEKFKERQRYRLKLEGFTDEFIAKDPNSSKMGWSKGDSPFLYALDDFNFEQSLAANCHPFRIGVPEVRINGVHE